MHVQWALHQPVSGYSVPQGCFSSLPQGAGKMKVAADYQLKHSSLGYEKSRGVMKADRFSLILMGILLQLKPIPT